MSVGGGNVRTAILSGPNGRRGFELDAACVVTEEVEEERVWVKVHDGKRSIRIAISGRKGEHMSKWDTSFELEDGTGSYVSALDIGSRSC